MTDRLRDVYLVDAVRTPIGRYAGVLAGTRPDDLAAHVVRGVIDRTSSDLDPARVDDGLLGKPNGAGEETATWAAWRCCSPVCPSPSPGPPSTGCAAPEWRPSARRRVPSRVEMPRSPSPVAWSPCAARRACCPSPNAAFRPRLKATVASTVINAGSSRCCRAARLSAPWKQAANPAAKCCSGLGPVASPPSSLGNRRSRSRTPSVD